MFWNLNWVNLLKLHFNSKLKLHFLRYFQLSNKKSEKSWIFGFENGGFNRWLASAADGTEAFLAQIPVT
jgi:hypothetical protein